MAVHHICIDINRIYRICNGYMQFAAKNIREISYVAFRPVAYENLIG